MSLLAIEPHTLLSYIARHEGITHKAMCADLGISKATVRSTKLQERNQIKIVRMLDKNCVFLFDTYVIGKRKRVRNHEKQMAYQAKYREKMRLGQPKQTEYVREVRAVPLVIPQTLFKTRWVPVNVWERMAA